MIMPPKQFPNNHHIQDMMTSHVKIPTPYKTERSYQKQLKKDKRNAVVQKQKPKDTHNLTQYKLQNCSKKSIEIHGTRKQLSVISKQQ